MGIKQNVFSLEQIYRLQVEGNWSTREEVWNTPSPFRATSHFGYFGGGSNYGGKTVIQRLDFSNDSANTVLRGTVTQGRGNLAATGNTNFGYFGGGYNSPSTNFYTTVDRLDYFNDTGTTPTKGPLTLARYELVATGNSSFGYFAGGRTDTHYPGPVSSKSTVDRIDYSNDTATAAPKGPLSAAKINVAATGNADFGYFGGGQGPGTSAVSTIERIDYSSDTDTASPKGPLNNTETYVAATGNASFGYFGGGSPGPTSSPAAVSNVDRVDYSSDTSTASPKGPLGNSRWGMKATGSSSFGYFAIGAPGPKTNIYRIDYSNDTATASTKGNIIFLVGGSAPTSAQANGLPQTSLLPALSSGRENVTPQGTDFGYFGGGYTGAALLSTVERIDYSNDTTVETKGPLSAARRYFGATGNASSGYFIGGSGSPSSTRFSTVDRVDYSNDTPTAVAKGPLSSVRSSFGATGNAEFGYVGGGKTPSSVSSVERIDYFNDTAATAPKGPLSAGRYNVTATGNQNFGYFGGGSHPVVSTVDRVDYSNDTVTAVAKGPLSAGKRYHAATGNADFGYFGGGYSSSTSATTSTVDRIDYSNDTATAVAKGPLGTARERMGATGNTSFGYFAGGQPSNSSANRVDYSNDTATAAVRGPLSTSKQSLTASSSRVNAIPLKGPGILEVSVAFGPFSRNYGPQGTDFGYVGGGNTYPGPIVSKVDRIDYSNDTTTAATKGPLSVARYELAATGNTNFGYFGGGHPGSKSTVDRIDYSNDTATASVRGPLSSVNRKVGATGNTNFGYFGGGTGNAGHSSKVDRVDYSNDTPTAVEKGPLSSARYFPAATGNASFGYFAGGYEPSSPNKISKVDRIDYSNDTATASPKGPLSAAKYRHAATGNADFGYFGGGSIYPSTPVRVSSVDRIDYSNDTATASPKGPLSITKDTPAATGNPSFGYFGGGEDPSTGISTVDRIDYSNDTATASPKGPLSVATYKMAASSSRANGIPTENIVNYAAGTYATSTFGYLTTPSSYGGRKVDRYDYSNDTADTSLRGTLPSSGFVEEFAATGNASFGYFGGGGPSPRTEVTRLNYFNDTGTPSPRGNLATATRLHAAYGNQNFGYYVGGDPSSYLSTTQRIDYATDNATASPKGPLSKGRSAIQNAGFGTQDFGYAGGGLNEGPRIDRLDYSNDTATALIRGNHLESKWNRAATGNANFGYIAGGYSHTSNVERLDYANDTVNTTLRCFLSTPISLGAGLGDLDFGYIAGGHRPGPEGGQKSSFERIDYANDTANTTIRGNRTSEISPSTFQGVASIGARSFGFTAAGPSVVPNFSIQAHNPRRYGYFAAGTPGAGSKIQRIDYQNDTATAVVKGALELSTAEAGSSSSSSFGYVFGGYSPRRSNVQRIEYANDTATTLERGSLNHARRHVKGTGNKDFGYAMGGDYPSKRSDVERIDYSNDTATASLRGDLTGVTYRNAATGNQNFGYVTINPSSILSTVNRVDYSNDSATAVVKGPLSVARTQLAATGNADFGYFAGGTTPSLASIVDRIDYSNDTATASPKGPLTYNGADLNATGNISFGYFAGGWPAISTIDRVDYSNDTATASTKGPLETGARQTAGFSATECANPQ